MWYSQGCLIKGHCNYVIFDVEILLTIIIYWNNNVFIIFYLRGVKSIEEGRAAWGSLSHPDYGGYVLLFLWWRQSRKLVFCPSEKHEATTHSVQGLADLLTRYFLIFWMSFFDGFLSSTGDILHLCCGPDHLNWDLTEIRASRLRCCERGKTMPRPVHVPSKVKRFTFPNIRILRSEIHLFVWRCGLDQSWNQTCRLLGRRQRQDRVKVRIWNSFMIPKGKLLVLLIPRQEKYRNLRNLWIIIHSGAGRPDLPPYLHLALILINWD